MNGRMDTHHNACERSLLTYLSLLKSHGNYQCFLLSDIFGYISIGRQHSELRAGAISWIFPGVGPEFTPLHLGHHTRSSSKHPITFIKTSHYFTALQCHCAVSTNLLQLKTSYRIHFKTANFLHSILL